MLNDKSRFHLSDEFVLCFSVYWVVYGMVEQFTCGLPLSPTNPDTDTLLNGTLIFGSKQSSGVYPILMRPALNADKSFMSFSRIFFSCKWENLT